MATYAFDVYPSDDPAGKVTATGTAARLVRLTVDSSMVSGWYKHVGHGLGEGSLSIHTDHPDATEANLHKRAYVMFVRTDTDPEQQIGGFLLEDGEFDALSRKEQGGRILTYGGPGGLFILDRYVLGHSVYATDQPCRGDCPSVPGMWAWRDEPYGAMLLRGIEEGKDHPSAFFAPLSVDFTRTRDSNDLLWDELTDYETVIGTSVLALYADFLRLGLVTQCSADLTVSAYRDINEFRTDRTSATFAAGKARFEGGVNILNDMPKRIQPKQDRTHVLIRDRIGDYETIDEDLDLNPLDSEPYMTFLTSDTTADDDAIRKMGRMHLTKRAQYVDQATVRHIIGSETGQYAPGPAGDYWVLDLVTLHTGTAQHDFNETPIEVASIRYYHDDAGNWFAEAELGAQYIHPTIERWQAQLSSTIRTIPPNLCRPGSLTTFTPRQLLGAACNNDNVNFPSGYAPWVPDSEERVEIAIAVAVPVGDSIIVEVGNNLESTAAFANDNRVYDEKGNTWTRDGIFTNSSSSQKDRIEFWRCNVTTALDAGDYIRWAVRGTTAAKGRCIAAYAYSGTVSNPVAGTGAGAINGTPSISTPAGGLVVAGLTYSGTGTVTPDADWDDMAPDTGVVGAGNAAKELFGQQILAAGATSWTLALSPDRDWAAIAVGYDVSGGSGSVGDGHPDLVGTSPRAARCDHRHDVHRARAPLPTDDWATAGYKLGTIWAQLDSLEDPTEIVGTWMLVDITEGAAVWLPLSGAAATVDAEDVAIADAGGYFTGTDVEAALQELGAAGPAAGGGLSLLDVSTMHRYPLWAHRGDIGSSDSYPENTVEALRQAILKGADGVEYDVQRSSDGTFWLLHDTGGSALNRTTDGTGSVVSKTDAAMAALNIDGGFGYDSGRHGTSLKVPTLLDVIEALQPYDAVHKVQLNASSDANATALAEFIVANGRPSQFLIEVSTLSEAAAVKAVSPALAVMVHTSVTGFDTDPNVDWISARNTVVTNLAYSTGKAPKRIGAYVSIDDFASAETTIFQQMWDRGAASFQTNHLDAALALRKALLFGSIGTHDHDADYEPLGAVAAHEAGHSSGGGFVTVDPGTITYDHSGDDVVVQIAAVWGFDADGPYYDDAGAATGEEAALVYDPDADGFAVIPYEVSP